MGHGMEHTLPFARVRMPLPKGSGVPLPKNDKVAGGVAETMMNTGVFTLCKNGGVASPQILCGAPQEMSGGPPTFWVGWMP